MNAAELKEKFAAMSAGDMTAFEEIYNHLKTPVFTIIFRITRDTSSSEDLLQEVFIKIYQSPYSPKIDNPRAYLFQTAHNLAVDFVRKQPQFADLASLDSLIYLPAADLTAKIDVEQAMKALPLQVCQIVSLRINGELKFREIADMLSLPLGTVLWKYQKAIKQLRIALSGGAV